MPNAPEDSRVHGRNADLVPFAVSKDVDSALLTQSARKPALYDQDSEDGQSVKATTASIPPIQSALHQESIQMFATTPPVAPEQLGPELIRSRHFQILRDSIACILPYFAMIPKTKSIAEPPLATGKHRVRWTCRCGIELWDDFTQLEDSAAMKLQRNL